jgi:hypothetical protein
MLDKIRSIQAYFFIGEHKKNFPAFLSCIIDEAMNDFNDKIKDQFFLI